MAALLAGLPKGEPTSQQDKTRKAVAQVLGEVRQRVEKVKDLKAPGLKSEQPVRTIVTAPRGLGVAGAGAELNLVIARVMLLEVQVRLRRSKPQR